MPLTTLLASDVEEDTASHSLGNGGNGFTPSPDANYLSDANDTTGYFLQSIGDGISSNETSSDVCRILNRDSAPVGAVTKIVITCRAGKVVASGAGTAGVQLFINSVSRSSVTALGAFANLNFTFANNPDTGVPWTQADIDGASIEFHLTSATTVPAGDVSAFLSEFRISVYQPTVYDADPALSEAFVPWPTLVGLNNYAPGRVTTLSAIVLRAASPSYMGDGVVDNIPAQYQGPLVGTNPLVFQGLAAATLVPYPGQIGAIESITIFANGFFAGALGGGYIHACTAASIRYTAPSGTATKPAVSFAPWKPLYDPGDAINPPLGPGRTIQTAPILTQPDGSAWTWGAVNALTNITPIISVSDTVGEGVYNRVGEIWVEVSGPTGVIGDPVVIRTSQIIGKDSVPGLIGTERATQGVGATVIKIGTESNPVLFP